MKKSIPWVLATALVALLVTVCTGPDTVDPDRADGAGRAGSVAELMVRLDGDLADRLGVHRHTVSALREMVLDRGKQITDLGPAVVVFASTRAALDNEVLALLAAIGDGDSVARALARANGDVEVAEQRLLESRRAAGSWQTFRLRRDRFAELAEAERSTPR